MKRNPYIFITLTLFFCAPVWAQQSAPELLTVSEAVTEAIQCNPAIISTQAEIEAAGQGVKSARADLLPQITAGYGYTSLQEAPIMKTEQGPLQVAHQYQYNWDVTLVQPLFAGFALSSQLDLAKLDSAARTLEKDQTILDLTRGVHAACYNLLLAQKLLQVSSDEVETLSAHKRDAELFHRQGLIPPNDELKAEVSLADALQTRERVQANVRKAEIRLNRLLDRPLENRIAIADVGDIPEESYDMAKLSTRALEVRPVMQLLDTGLKQLGLAQKIARSTWFPRVSLVGSVDYTGDNLAADENDYSNTNNSFVALKAEWHFWSSGKTRAEVNRVRRQIKALEARIDSMAAQVQEEVRSALLDCQVARKNIATADQALVQARENWRITDIQYRQQVATSTDVLDARTFLTQADTNYYRAVYGYLDAVAGLERAVGDKMDQQS